MRILLFITLILFSSISCAINEAENHISKMLNIYKSLNSYEDDGSTSITITNRNGDINTENKTFSTYYSKNSLLKFKWSVLPAELDKELYKLTKNKKILIPKNYVVWKDSTGSYSQYSNKKKENKQSINIALSSATGISNSLAWLVPRFLSPDITCAPNLSASNSEIISISNNIIKVKQKLPSGTIRILHINKNTYLLMKYESIKELSSGTSYHQISEYNIRSYN